ncbi:MAG: endolytic transglycosylase MltG [Candidatus Jorgensenbacteria bacterium]
MNPQIGKRGLLNSRFTITLAVIIFFILVIAYFFWGLQPNADKNGNGEIIFKISKGEGLKEISARLSQGGLIKSIAVFKTYSLISGSARKLQPGVHELSAKMSVPQIIRQLTKQGENEVTVTIPEGSALKDIDSMLVSAQVIEEDSIINFPIEKLEQDFEFLTGAQSLEGFLFPDTYRFEVSSGAETVLRRLLDNFEEKAWPLLKTENNWYDLLILASYLEREVPDFNDRRIVAGILLKRLSIGMPLQVDATISYLKCDGELRGCGEIVVTRGDLTLPSPYNTYERLGWTPTPISNPGQSAIRAAAEPEKSPYFYYLSTEKTGETIFSRTLDEHNENRVKYL